ncbi:hypothetical protein GCM10009663_14370 [Kitasatospora arboriphila]|uniref:Uncharacterized protein n=1 Tax=Kitasatospora arboriphila TaxID=258052 RepID=A0ABN1TEX5_9ACTN
MERLAPGHAGAQSPRPPRIGRQPARHVHAAQDEEATSLCRRQEVEAEGKYEHQDGGGLGVEEEDDGRHPQGDTCRDEEGVPPGSRRPRNAPEKWRERVAESGIGHGGKSSWRAISSTMKCSSLLMV